MVYDDYLTRLIWFNEDSEWIRMDPRLIESFFFLLCHFSFFLLAGLSWPENRWLPNRKAVCLVRYFGNLPKKSNMCHLGTFAKNSLNSLKIRPKRSFNFGHSICLLNFSFRMSFRSKAIVPAIAGNCVMWHGISFSRPNLRPHEHFSANAPYSWA